MRYFFCYNMDFVHLPYGLVFIVLATIAFLLAKIDSRFAWKSLFWFGVAHGIHQWLDLLSFSQTPDMDNYVKLFRFLTLLFSFVMLFNFGLSFFWKSGKTAFKPWLYLILMAGCYISFPHEWYGLNSSCRIFFGTPGAFMAGLAFWYSRKKPNGEKSACMTGLAGLFLLFGVLTCVLPTESNYFFGNGQNDILFNTVGVPVQVFRSILGLAIVIILWQYYCRMKKENNGNPKFPSLSGMIAQLTIVVIAGWLLIAYSGEKGGEHVSMEQVNRARIVAFLIRDMIDKNQSADSMIAQIPQYGQYRLSLTPDKKSFVFERRKPRNAPLRQNIPIPPADLHKIRNYSPVFVPPFNDTYGCWIAAIAEVKPRRTMNEKYYFIIMTDAESWLHEVAAARRNATLPLEVILLLIILSWATRIISSDTTHVALQSAARYRGLVKSQNDMIIRLDQRCRLTFANDVFYHKTGLDKEKLCSHPLSEISNFETFENCIKSTLTDFPLHYKLLQKLPVPDSADVQWIEWDIHPVSYDTGDIMEFQGIGRDITALKSAVNAYEKSEKKYRQLVDLAGEGIWSIDANNLTTFANPKMAEMLGTTVTEMQGASMFEFIPESEINYARENVDRRQQGIEEQHEFVFQKKNEGTLHANLATTPLYDENGNYSGALAVVVDIGKFRQMETDLKKIMEELKNTLSFSQLILDTDPNIIFVKNEKERLIMANEAMTNFFNLEISQMLNVGFAELMSENSFNPPLEETDRYVLQTMKPYEYDQEIKTADARTFWYRTTKTPFTLVDGTIGILTIAMDITKRKSAELALAEVNRALENKVQERTVTLKNTISQLAQEIDKKQKLQLMLQEESERIQERLGQDLHDVLGQTLTAISLKATILGQITEEHDTQKKQISEQIVEYAGEAMVQMRNIAQILSSANLTRHGLERELNNFQSFIMRCFDVEVNIDIDNSIIACMSIDTQKNLFRIVQESVMNGIRHGQSKIINVVLKRENNQCVLSIKNNGTGINKTNETTGIGLMIMKTRAEVIGATLEIVNHEECGVEIICRFTCNHG